MDVRLGRRQLLATSGLALLWPRELFAAARGASLAELIAHSTCCVVGRPVAAESRWVVLGGARRIVTLHTLETDDVLAGDAVSGAALQVRTLGGRVGGLMQRVFGEAELIRDQTALLFLLRVDDSTHVVTDMAGGYFPVRTDAAGVHRLHASRALLPAAQAGAAELLDGRSVTELRPMLDDTARGLRAR
jgi:hypothetical protein